MSEHDAHATPIRHLFIDTHTLTTDQRERLALRLKRLLGLQYFTELDRPGDGTATVLVPWELEDVELVEARIWRLIKRVYRPQLLLDEEVGRLRTLHDVLPPPDTRQAIARREETRRTTGSRSAWLIQTNAVDIYPFGPFTLNGSDFDPETGEPPALRVDDLTRQVAEYYPTHQSQAKEFIQALDRLLRRYVRLLMADTGPRWRRCSRPGDAACAAFRYFRGIIADVVCTSHQTG